MPEIAEVARAVHHLRKNLVGKTLAVVKAQDDANVYGKVGTSGAEFQKSLAGKKVLGAGQQGKYFWLTMESPPHPVFHFGMTGWIRIRGQHTFYYRPEDNKDAEDEEWPPRWWKFTMETKEEPKVQAAFIDSRRFARIRLVDCAAEDIRNTTPLKENGPDPVIDKEILTAEWLEAKLGKKHVPIKALMLDQANISGIGNWVGDEILYHAKLHPEQYSDTFSSAQVKRLHASMMYVCQTAVDLLADSHKFPEEWLFKHRWGKGKKDAATTLPNGEKIIYITVGGRTSCIVPAIQKKTGATAEEGKLPPGEDVSGEKKPKAQASRKRKASPEQPKEESLDEQDDSDQKITKKNAVKGKEVKKKAGPKNTKSASRATGRGKKADEVSIEQEVKQESPPTKSTKITISSRKIKQEADRPKAGMRADGGAQPRRRSGRISKDN